MKFTSTSISEMRQIAADFLSHILKLRRETATVVGLYGNLGSGKTAFVQCVAEILGVKEHVTSPTFVILKRFKIHDSRFTNLIHVDAYRLKSGEELRKLGFEELIQNPANLIFVEWADHVSDILPPNHLKLRFEYINETSRKIIL